MRDLDTLILIAAGIFAVAYVLPIFADARAYAVDPELATLRSDTRAPRTGTLGAGSNTIAANAWSCITHRERLQVTKDPVTVTGTVIPAGDGGAHYAPDGDLVFAFKPDPQFANLLNDKNMSNKKYGGGLWVEGVCQKANKATEPRHQGDCKCNAPKFAAPKNGERYRITGAHAWDVGEDGHGEIHPVYSMVKI